MRLDDLIDRAEVFLPQYKHTLKELIRFFPKNSEKWFYTPRLPADLYQGDLIRDIPILLLSRAGKPVGQISTVMLLSNTCDMNKRETDYITVARARDFDAYIKKGKRPEMSEGAWNNHLSSIQKNLLTRFLYVPGSSNFPPLIIDFEAVCSLSHQYVFTLMSKLPTNRIASLSQKGYYVFAVKLSCHFLRAEPQDVTRKEIL